MVLGCTGTSSFNQVLAIWPKRLALCYRFFAELRLVGVKRSMLFLLDLLCSVRMCGLLMCAVGMAFPFVSDPL